MASTLSSVLTLSAVLLDLERDDRDPPGAGVADGAAERVPRSLAGIAMYDNMIDRLEVTVVCMSSFNGTEWRSVAYVIIDVWYTLGVALLSSFSSLCTSTSESISTQQA